MYLVVNLTVNVDMDMDIDTDMDIDIDADSTGPAAEPSGRFPPPLLAGGGMGTPPVHWQAGGGDLYI